MLEPNPTRQPTQHSVQPPAQLSPAAWQQRLICVVAIAGIGIADFLSQGLLSPFYCIPVVYAALREGWLGGLLAALASAALMLWVEPQTIQTASAIHALAYLLLGLSAGWMADRERRQKTHYQKVSEQLSTVYEKVQANFEGMKRAERLSALGQLSAGLAHEIRNPLASISGAASILQRNPELDAKQAKCIDVIRNECNRLNDLLTNFLNFARPRPPRLQTIEIESVLDNVLALAFHGVRNRAVNFEKQIAPGLPSVECDPEQLEQVLLNLMINAVEASPDGETVTLSAACTEHRVAVRVTDRGHGVAPSHVDRLFDPFFTTKEHGTGLGLPVAHQIMTQMGGSLRAERNAGTGMTFSVILPANQAEQ